MSIAVTGATGQLGRLVVDHLLKFTSGDDLVAIVRDSAKAAPLAAQGVEVRVASYDDREALATALDDVDTLLLISSSEVGKRFGQHKNVIDAAVAAGVSRLVYTSAPKATTTTLVLAPDHKATEEYIAETGVTSTILRNGWYTENYLAQIEPARLTGKLVAAAGEGRVASATRTEYAEAAARVLTESGHEGKVYELSGDYAWNYEELAQTLAQLVERDVEYVAVDGPTLVGILVEHGLDEQTAGFVAQLDLDTADGVLAGTSKSLSELLGRPTDSLYDGLKQSIQA